MPGLVSRYYDRTEGLDPLLRMMYLDVKSWLPDDLLIKADKMTMATSVELRVPFLDHRVVELGGRIPPRYRVKGWETKYILKKAMEPYLPKEILYRGKMGFPTPLARMFQGELRDYVAGVLDQRPLPRSRLLPARGGEVDGAEHAAGETDHHRVLWQLLVLEEWHRKFIDGEKVAESWGVADIPDTKDVRTQGRKERGSLSFTSLQSFTSFVPYAGCCTIG